MAVLCFRLFCTRDIPQNSNPDHWMPSECAASRSPFVSLPRYMKLLCTLAYNCTVLMNVERRWYCSDYRNSAKHQKSTSFSWPRKLVYLAYLTKGNSINQKNGRQFESIVFTWHSKSNAITNVICKIGETLQLTIALRVYLKEAQRPLPIVIALPAIRRIPA